jgi:hypothetical protein
MGHPNGKVARASHSMFAAFISSGKDPDQDERVSLKEQLVFYYMQRSLSVSKAIETILVQHKLLSLIIKSWVLTLFFAAM